MCCRFSVISRNPSRIVGIAEIPDITGRHYRAVDNNQVESRCHLDDTITFQYFHYLYCLKHFFQEQHASNYNSPRNFNQALILSYLVPGT